MPWGDRTGPMGAGPRSGRGLGFCNGYAQAGYLTGGVGRGLGFRRGGGFGFGRGAGFGARYGYGYAPYTEAPTKDEEKTFLESEIGRLSNTIDSLKRRLDELKD